MNNCCVCGSRQTFAQCCEPFIKHGKVAATPEQLMRSRYSAYALGGCGEYLLKTWFAPMAKGLTPTQLSETSQEWLGLKVIGSGSSGNEGWVEFRASYRRDGVQGELHEKSAFTMVGSRWLYIGGEITTFNE